MDNDVLKDLRKPFPDEIIEKRRGQGGKMLSYVSGDRVIERLLDTVGAFSWEILSVEPMTSLVVVRGRLTALGVSVDGVDGHPLTASTKDGEISPETLFNAIKSADTGALVRAARLLGVGLELWIQGPPAAGIDERDEQRGGTPAREPDRERPALSLPRDTKGGPRPMGTGSPSHNERASERQLGAIRAISRSLGWTKEKLASECIEKYGCELDLITRADASAFIGELQKIVTKGGGDAGR